MPIQPTTKSRYLSLIVIFLFLVAFGLLAYLPAALEQDVNKNVFTISQSLAYSIKPAFIVVFSIASLLFGYLMYYRGHDYLFTRLFLLLVISAFVITILWVTTFYNKDDHYILAGIIFSLTVLFIIINNYVIYKGMKLHGKYKTLFLVGTPILAILGLFGLIIGMTVLKNEIPVFPAFENYMIIIESLSVIALGFM